MRCQEKAKSVLRFSGRKLQVWVRNHQYIYTPFHFFPKKLEMLFMPFLLTLARLLCAWLMGCFALVAAAAASAFVCGGSRMNDATGARSIKKKAKHHKDRRGWRRGGGEQTGYNLFPAYVRDTWQPYIFGASNL